MNLLYFSSISLCHEEQCFWDILVEILSLLLYQEIYCILSQNVDC